jgi:hypothetical protein
MVLVRLMAVRRLIRVRIALFPRLSRNLPLHFPRRSPGCLRRFQLHSRPGLPPDLPPRPAPAGGDYTLFSVAEGAVTQERAAAEDPAEGPAGNAAENAANTPENASENATEDSAKGAEKERSVPESTDEQP